MKQILIIVAAILVSLTGMAQTKEKSCGGCITITGCGPCSRSCTSGTGVIGGGSGGSFVLVPGRGGGYVDSSYDYDQQFLSLAAQELARMKALAETRRKIKELKKHWDGKSDE